MTINSFLKILSGMGTVARTVTKEATSRAHNTVEDAVLKGNYVSREEFEALKSMVLEMRTKLGEYSTKNKKT